jgi:cellulose synthase/poly-beta-1,6-N-acetylglucosamine synthase-like glycosyltransferase
MHIMTILRILDYLLFVPALLYAAYLLFFALMALTYRSRKDSVTVQPRLFRKMLVLIPAYAEDFVVKEAVHSFLAQDYPRERYDVCVISDHMTDQTNQELAALPVILEIASFPEGSTKVKALNLGMKTLEGYDVAVIMDADNTVDVSFLSQINHAFDRGSRVVQAHRKAKKTNTPFQVLDALSEEINNTIFRLGHVQIGLSSALIGSGMAFEFGRFKRVLSGLESVGGFDKELEHVYLRDGYRFDYLQDTFVYDEKIRRPDDFARQRRRWLSAQFVYLRRFGPEIPLALLKGRFDYLDKILQTAMPPRVLFLGGTFLLALLVLLMSPGASVKWWALWLSVCAALALSVPSNLWNRNIFLAFLYLGQAFGLMFLTLFRLKGANRKFIHTRHGD